MNTNEINSANRNTRVSLPDREMESADLSPLGVIERAADIIESQIRHLTIEEGSEALDLLEQLRFLVNEGVLSRIPADSLSFVEGSWYLSVSVDPSDDLEATRKKQARVLMASPLRALEGYARQLLDESKEARDRLSDLAAEPENPFPVDTAHRLAVASDYCEALSTALGDIQAAVSAHGPDMIAMDAGLDSACIDAIIEALRDGGDFEG